MSFSGNMTKLATKRINKYGNSITLVERSNGIYNPAIGENTWTEVQHTIRGSMTGYTIAEQQSEYINTGDIKVLIQTTLPVNTDWVVTYESKEWQIVAIETTTTQDTTVVSALQIRS